MHRLARAVSIALPLILVASPRLVHAGGPEFPGGGTRSLGRGGAAMARADDPSVMVRNPALLADLWDDQAMLGAHLLLPDACFQATGRQGQYNGVPSAANFGDGPVPVEVPDGSTDLDGNPIDDYGDEPYPEVCYQGPAPFLPQVALAMKLTPRLGVGIGFFPPDAASIFQWGNRDGTVETEKGLRPNPLRYSRSMLATSFFTLLSAAGYRLADWIRIGAGFQWNLVVFQSISWTTPQADTIAAAFDVKTYVWGRDLFIPGFTASVQLKPFDMLDVAVGFRWSDRVKSKVKLDITSGAFGTGEAFRYLDPNGVEMGLASTIPTTSNNQFGTVTSPPIWVPQLSLGVRLADRLKPAPRDWELAHKTAGRVVEDSMETERWDVELDAIYYFNSVFDKTRLVNSSDTRLTLVNVGPTGTIGSVPSSAGQCFERDDSGNCIGDRITEAKYAGKDQISLRLGGDYNLFPGRLALRGGVSYENDGQDIEYLNVLYYMLGRVGLHAGVTLRVAEKTDISFGFAHFIQKNVHLQVNEIMDQGATYPPVDKQSQYHFQPGEGVKPPPSDPNPNDPDPTPGDFDGIAHGDIPNGDAVRVTPGPHYINAGSYFYNLEVVSLTFTQHF